MPTLFGYPVRGRESKIRERLAEHSSPPPAEIPRPRNPVFSMFPENASLLESAIRKIKTARPENQSGRAVDFPYDPNA